MAKKTPAAYEIVALPRVRNLIVDLLRSAHRKHMIHGLVEVDVTGPRRYIRDEEARTGRQLSFTAFIMTCLGKAVDADKSLHAMRNWRGQLVLFEDVDVSSIVEVPLGDGMTIPVPHLFRAVNKRTYRDINDEMQAAQAVRTSGDPGKPMRQFASLPRFVRAALYWLNDIDLQRKKQRRGTVALTAIGMFGSGGGWGIPLVVYTLNVTVGGIAEKPGVVDGRIEIREYLSLTITFDHDLVDGGPAARFTERFKGLIESGVGLMEQKAAAGASQGTLGPATRGA